MLKGFFHNYFLTKDSEQLFFGINFDPKKLTPDQSVLVFNYGLVCSNEQFRYQIEYFHQQNRPILYHDYRGHFVSTGKNNLTKITYQQIAEDAIELLNFLNIKSCITIGHSMGVNICFEMFRLAPATQKGMILITGTNFPVNEIMFNTNLMSFVFPIFQQVLKNDKIPFMLLWEFLVTNPVTEKLIHHQGFNVKTVDSEFIRTYLYKIAELGPELFATLYDQMNSHFVNNIFPDINIPVLIISGDSDKVIPPWIQYELAESLNFSELYIVHEGSHVPQVDFPQMINERIEVFLETHQLN